jgi:hypothetical protein
MWKSLALPAMLSLPLWALAESTAPKTVYPIEAELIGSLNAAQIKVGDRVLAKIDHEWTYDNCKLPNRAVIRGRITQVTTRPTSKLSTVALSFVADCGDGGQQPLTWIALMAPDENANASWHDGKPVLVHAPRSSSFGESSTLGAPPASQGNHADMSNRQAPNLPLLPAEEPDRSHPRPSAVKTGEVWRIPNLLLSVASGPEGSSVLSSSNKVLHLETGSVLVLSPTPSVYAAASAAPGAAAASSYAALPSRELPPAINEQEICAASTCSIALPTSVSETSSATAKSVSLAGLGYRPRLVAEIADFDYDAAMVYLGPTELLFTFNPHSLIVRTSDEEIGSRLHMVRAVLIDLTTSRVERTVEWRVGDGKQYLWPIHNNRVLVHIGNELKMFGPGLQEESKFELAGPLAFVTYSPDQKHFAVGVVREIHTNAIHSQIAATTSGEPEEEVETMLLNDRLEGKAAGKQSSRFRAPVLSDRGEIVLTRAGREHWKYKEAGWDGQTRTLVELASSCTPEMTSLAPNLLFVIGCDTGSVDRWFRVLRINGSPVLVGTSLMRDMKPIALANDTGDAFALTLRRGNAEYVEGDPFRGTDIESESVGVYRATNGQKLLAANMRSPLPTMQTVAFAPGGGQLAVLDGDKIAIFNVTH